uniref:Si:dkey-32e6.3 n=3 Tax=Scleropages formosus TaxID=113540 RepID=A0A8C9SVD6_SCLFO
MYDSQLASLRSVMLGGEQMGEVMKNSTGERTGPGETEDQQVSFPCPSLLRRKVVLHMDLNNTILVSDSVTKQGTVAALDCFLSTVTWGRLRQGKWEWMSDSPSLLPPCEGTVSYYSQFGRVANFTKTPAGRRFRGLLEEHLAMLRWPAGHKEDRDLSVRGEDGQLYHWILPSFFQLLQDLGSQGREFAILFRTFGTDLPRLLGTLQRVLTQGCHPLFPDLPALKLSINVVPGRIRRSRKGTSLSRAEEHVSYQDGERSLYQYFSSVQGLGGFQDHFDWWARNTYSILGGKPLLVDPYDHRVQHIFIDDNIRQDDKDTIVHPKVFLEPGATQTRTASTLELYDICLVQNHLLKAISDHSYFTQCVQICLENYETNLMQGAC